MNMTAVGVVFFIVFVLVLFAVVHSPWVLLLLLLLAGLFFL